MVRVGRDRTPSRAGGVRVEPSDEGARSWRRTVHPSRFAKSRSSRQAVIFIDVLAAAGAEGIGPQLPVIRELGIWLTASSRAMGQTD